MNTQWWLKMRCISLWKVEIHAGEQINDMSLMGTMRFTIAASSDAVTSTSQQ